MTKVASLANNANMSFEKTSAFLAQIIETTRESAETAGTALKTVVARFSEVKELYTKGQLLGADSEGEEININRVSKALATAGINLNEYFTGMKGLDDIFIELASKWDSLDEVQ
jgi:TP901 family phage tail tape measure protein